MLYHPGTLCEHNMCLNTIRRRNLGLRQRTIIVGEKGLDTCYSAAYLSQTQEQQRFTISEVAADWSSTVERPSTRATTAGIFIRLF